MSCDYAQKLFQASHSLIQKGISVHKVLHVRIILRQGWQCIAVVVWIYPKALMKLSEIVEPAFDSEGLTIVLETFEFGFHFDVEKCRTLIKHRLFDLFISSDLYVYLVLQKIY
jgi:hypothetical protein